MYPAKTWCPYCNSSHNGDKFAEGFHMIECTDCGETFLVDIRRITKVDTFKVEFIGGSIDFRE